MDTLEVKLQDVLNDLDDGLARLIDSPTTPVATRMQALAWRTTLGRMRVAIFQPGGQPDEREPTDIEREVDELKRRTAAIPDGPSDDDVRVIGDHLDDTMRVMSIVGKWPPA